MMVGALVVSGVLAQCSLKKGEKRKGREVSVDLQCMGGGAL